MREIKSYSSLYEYLRSWWGEKDKVFTFSPISGIKIHVIAMLDKRQQGYKTVILVQLNHIYFANFYFFHSYTALYDTIETLESFFSGVRMYITYVPGNSSLPTLRFIPGREHLEIITMYSDKTEKVSIPWELLEVVQGFLDLFRDKITEYFDILKEVEKEVSLNE